MESKCEVYPDAEGDGYWVYIVGIDIAGYPFSRPIAWFELEQDANNYIES